MVNVKKTRVLVTLVIDVEAAPPVVHGETTLDPRRVQLNYGQDTFHYATVCGDAPDGVDPQVELFWADDPDMPDWIRELRFQYVPITGFLNRAEDPMEEGGGDEDRA